VERRNKEEWKQTVILKISGFVAKAAGGSVNEHIIFAE
jgi:hypothetical protein